MTSSQKQLTVSAPRIALHFLLRPAGRKKSMQRSGFGDESGINESGAFYRMWDLFFTLKDAEARELLDKAGREAYLKFENAMQSMPWRPIESHSHIKQINDGDLSSLVQPGKELDRHLRRLAWKYATWRERARIVLYFATHWGKE